MFLLIPRTRISTTVFFIFYAAFNQSRCQNEKQNMCRGLGNNNKINEVRYLEQIFKLWPNNITKCKNAHYPKAKSKSPSTQIFSPERSIINY